jgi:hypothetical protein
MNKATKQAVYFLNNEGTGFFELPTQEERVLNVHCAYEDASAELKLSFSLARKGGVGIQK